MSVRYAACELRSLEEDMLHKFARTEMLIGSEALKKLSISKVAVFGIGGVGTFVVEGLVRAGVGKFILIDDDCVCLTNINRQIHATMKTIGKPKVELMRDRILEINPDAEVITHQKFYMPGMADEIGISDCDYIVDAIDTVKAKIDLVISAKKMVVKIISSMGTGNKLDPTRFEINDIYKTSVCPLARVMRQELRKRGVDSLKVLFSKEEPLTYSKADDSKEECAYTDDILREENETASTRKPKRRVPGSISFVPSVAGLIIAGEVIKDLINKN